MRTGIFYRLIIYSASFIIVFGYALGDTTFHLWADANQEYELYKQIALSGIYQPYLNNLLSACPVTTLVPAIVQRFIGWDLLLFYKLYLSLLISFLPVAVYQLALTYKTGRLALLAPALIMCQFHFARGILFARINIALLFWCLMLIGLCSVWRHRQWLVAVCGGLVVLTHYATAFMILPALAIASLIKRRWDMFIACVSVGLCGLAWYGFIAKAPLYTLSKLYDRIAFFNYDLSRGDFWHMGLVVNWGDIAEVIAFVAFWAVLLICLIGLRAHKQDRAIALISLVPMASVYIMPGLELWYGFIRFHYFALIALAPLFVFGVRWLYEKQKWGILVVGSLVIIGYSLPDVMQARAVGVVMFSGMTLAYYFWVEAHEAKRESLAGGVQ